MEFGDMSSLKELSDFIFQIGNEKAYRGEKISIPGTVLKTTCGDMQNLLKSTRLLITEESSALEKDGMRTEPTLNESLHPASVHADEIWTHLVRAVRK